jgi:ketosteroid isomerase-like protein
MKLAIIAVVIVLSSSLACFAQTEHADKTAKIVLQVMKIEAAWGPAVLRHDAKAFARILADNYIGTSSNGETRNKTQTLNRLKSAEDHFDSLTACDLDLNIDGNKVIVTGHVAAKLKVQNQIRESCFSYTRVYEKRKRRWQVVSSQTDRMTMPCCGPKQ